MRLCALPYPADRLRPAMLLRQNGRTPLHYAASRGHVACIELLVSHGADKSTKNKVRRERTCFCASSYGSVRSPPRPRRLSAAPTPQFGKTPLDVAKDEATRAALLAARSRVVAAPKVVEQPAQVRGTTAHPLRCSHGVLAAHRLRRARSRQPRPLPVPQPLRAPTAALGSCLASPSRHMRAGLPRRCSSAALRRASGSGADHSWPTIASENLRVCFGLAVLALKRGCFHTSPAR